MTSPDALVHPNVYPCFTLPRYVNLYKLFTSSKPSFHLLIKWKRRQQCLPSKDEMKCKHSAMHCSWHILDVQQILTFIIINEESLKHATYQLILAKLNLSLLYQEWLFPEVRQTCDSLPLTASHHPVLLTESAWFPFGSIPGTGTNFVPT